VNFPRPEPGLVIRYAYLWLSEYREGREDGTEDRPCAVVLAIADDEGETRVTVLPVTHRPPADPSTAVELPIETKRRLGLDAERSWIVLSEGNEFLWPGPDVRPVPGADPASIAYGFLPPRLFDLVPRRFLALARERKARRVPRAE
jgi:hypothetical protein